MAAKSDLSAEESVPAVRPRRRRRVAVALIIVVACAVSYLWLFPRSSYDSPRTWVPCWFPDSGKVACSTLVMVNGRTPQGDIIDLSRVYTVWPSKRTWSEVQLQMDPISPCPKGFWITYRITGRSWQPDFGGIGKSGTILVGCPVGGASVASSLSDADFYWLVDFLRNPFQSQVIDDETVRLYNDSSWIVLRWA